MTRQCTATSKRSGERCKRAPHPGAGVCVVHGAGSPKVKRRAAERVAMERAEGMLDKYGPAMPVTNMPRLLQQVAGRAERISHALEDRVNEMTSMSTYSDKAGEQLRAEVGALMTCWNLLRQIATDATKLDLEAWSVRIEAAKAAAIVAVLEAGVCAAGLDDVQAWRLREAMRDGLNELEAGA